MADPTPNGALNRVGGAEHRLLLSRLVAYEALARVKHQLLLPSLASRPYQKYFANKIGKVVSVKKPYYTFVTSGKDIGNGDKAAMIDEHVDIVVDKRRKFAIEWDDELATFDMIAFGERYLQSGAEELAYRFDIDGFETLLPALHFTDGVPGNALTSTKIAEVRAHATHQAMPRDSSCYGILNPLDFIDLKDEFQGPNGSPQMPDSIVNQVLRSRFKGVLSDWKLFESVHIPDYVVPDGVSTENPQVAGASQAGTGIMVDGYDTSHTSTRTVYRKGNIITFAGVEEIQPRGTFKDGTTWADRKSTGRLKTFTVTEDFILNTGVGQGTIKIAPEIITEDSMIDAGDGTDISRRAFQNVSAGPADNAAVNVLGQDDTSAVGGRYRQGVFFHRNCLHYINAILESPKSATYTGLATDKETGLALTLTTDYDINTMEELTRIDCYYGIGVLRDDFGIRFLGERISAS